MRRPFDSSKATVLYDRAEEKTCPFCGRALWIFQHRRRFVFRRDGLYALVRQDKRCPNKECEGSTIIYRPRVDIRFALPRVDYGLDVAIEFGERHLRDGLPLNKIRRQLNARGVPVSQRQSCRLFRTYVTLTKLVKGDEQALRQKLSAQGGIVLMVDGVQYDNKSPVLYLLWDAISGEPLFGERKPYRGEEDLVPLLEKVKAMDVPVIGVVTDKECGLVPAIKKVFPGVPYQYCQIHFLKNAALGHSEDLAELGESVEDRAKKACRVAKRLRKRGVTSMEHWEGDRLAEELPELGPSHLAGRLLSSLSEEQLTAELCAMARHAARATGRAPLAPPELIRHQGLERVRMAAEEAAKKGGTGSSASPRR
jgi:hypothetical protein